MAKPPIKRVQKELRKLRRQRKTDINRFVRGIDLIYKEAIQEVRARLRNKDITVVEAAGSINALDDFLKQNGFKEQYREIRTVYREELKSIKKLTAAASTARESAGIAKISVGSLDSATVSTLMRIELDKTTKLLQKSIVDVKSTLLRSVITGAAINFKSITEGFTSKLSNQLRTEINTSVGIFNKTLTTSRAKESGFELFLYVGPDDSVTRDFCQQVLGGTIDGLNKGVPIYTLDEIGSMDNGQISDTLISAGGYNCRHEFIPVSLEYAKELGFDG